MQMSSTRKYRQNGVEILKTLLNEKETKKTFQLQFSYFPKYDLFSKCHFPKCDGFFLSVTPFFSKLDPTYHEWPIFISGGHFSKLNTFFQVWPWFANVTDFPKRDLFFQLWAFFPTVTFFPIFVFFFQVWPIYNGFTFWSKWNPF